MFNVLIIDNNVEEAKNILNQIVKKYKNLRITGIATNTKEMLNFLNHKDNDLIILIYPFSDISIDFIFKKHKNYKVNSFIVFFNSNNKVWLKKLNNNPYVYKLLYDCNKINSLINSISNFIYTDYISLNRKILQELLLLRFNPSYKGTKYLLDIITIIYKDPLLL